jgi:hypothetical protein
VYDSLDRTSIGGAAIQLVSVGRGSRVTRGATTDSAGRFVLTSLPSGEYLIAFVHPLLDSLRIEPPAYKVSARSGAATNVTLAVPSPIRLHDVICGARPKNDSTGVVIGHLYDAESRAGMSKAQVTVRWLEWTITSKGLVRTPALRSATTTNDGWFAICDVPTVTQVALRAMTASDSTAEIEVEIPNRRLLRRDMFLGASQTTLIPSPDSAGVPDSLRTPATYVVRGNARLSGIVRRSDSNTPLDHASVTIAGSGMIASTDENGRFTLGSLPPGTRMLETRAVGFLPDRRIIDLFADTTRSLEITLPTIKSVLDTVRTTARRLYAADGHGFERRRRNSSGTFFGVEDVERIRPIATSGLLRRVPTVRMESGSDGKILMPGPLYYCTPMVFIDGFRLDSATARDIDEWVAPEEIDGIEVYTRNTQVPPQFSSMSACGAIVIWTRPFKKKD